MLQSYLVPRVSYFTAFLCNVSKAEDSVDAYLKVKRLFGCTCVADSVDQIFRCLFGMRYTNPFDGARPRRILRL